MMAGRKTGWATTGVEGLASWSIGDTEKILSVMYSLPFNFDFHMNYLAIGIHNKIEKTTEQNQSAEKRFQKMLSGTEEQFKRKPFYYDIEPLRYTDDENRFTISGIMGKEHRCTIEILLKASGIEERAVLGN